MEREPVSFSEQNQPRQRKIIHCDCDCFYASIEMRDNPALRGKPIAVGGSPERRGVVATCNYEAREFGIHSAMASATARRLCPDLIIIRTDMEKYRLASSQIHEIFQRYTDLIEPLSLDEAFLDVSDCDEFRGSATRIAEAIRNEVREVVGITISAGIAPNKFLAKIASDWNKPDGQFAVLPNDVDDFVAKLAVKKLHGVGKVTAAKMHRLNLRTCKDLQNFGADALTEHFGSFGERLFELSRGIDNRPVSTDRIRKSVSVENTFDTDLPDLDSSLEAMLGLLPKLELRLKRLDNHYAIKKQFVKLKFHDFVTTTVEMLSEDTNPENYRTLCEQGFARGERAVRLIGVGVRVEPLENSAEVVSGDQLSLLPADAEYVKKP
ncbi:MAG: DNA polymerase IV [OM182 bacterium]|jgi:DNA polymerase IV|uniref:DNA polymerase IV n=2 Tax=OM182 clade TaxID=745002 RepID=A0A0R2XWA0_9GAMM|nr:MAG: DNA polymerase IV [OM182 bacterium BACL3 MAG-120531-bin86]MDP4660175.1 DNA polymerase IV [OM182 bacterium]MDP4783194.1 DNA polymerase IV [Gammaproteobacteria bacterium]MDP4768941.1 DNA polymerase IV [OM182 bacterium]MDP4784223.1 DNA polymerase IV [Gammaproteobacteria bacterium]